MKKFLALFGVAALSTTVFVSGASAADKSILCVYAGPFTKIASNGDRAPAPYQQLSVSQKIALRPGSMPAQACKSAEMAVNQLLAPLSASFCPNISGSDYDGNDIYVEGLVAAPGSQMSITALDSSGRVIGGDVTDFACPG